jgi:hypothetical protein
VRSVLKVLDHMIAEGDYDAPHKTIAWQGRQIRKIRRRNLERGDTDWAVTRAAIAGLLTCSVDRVYYFVRLYSPDVPLHQTYCTGSRKE